MKPSSFFYKQIIRKNEKDGFKFLSLAETDISPYYTLAVLHKKDKKFIQKLMRQLKDGNKELFVVK